MVPETQPPKSPGDWLALSARELENVRALYEGRGSNDAKIDHALKAVEAVLKAIIWKYHPEWAEWPERKDRAFLYGHNLHIFLKECPDQIQDGLRGDANCWASWLILASASLRHVRYSPEKISNAEADSIARAARHPDEGIIPWLRKRYREMK